jgi:hypothetical protein
LLSTMDPAAEDADEIGADTWRLARLAVACPNDTRNVIVTLRRIGDQDVSFANLRVQYLEPSQPLSF